MKISNDKILIFGCGDCAKALTGTFGIDPENVIGFVESKKSNDTSTGGGDSINSSGRKFSMSTR